MIFQRVSHSFHWTSINDIELKDIKLKKTARNIYIKKLYQAHTILKFYLIINHKKR